MQNIITYFNTFLNVIFGSRIFIVSPADLLDWFINNPPADLWGLIVSFLQRPPYLISLVVWSWFAWLSFHLLLIWPFKWIRSVVTRK